jgi:hypothetical protein
MSIAMTWVRKFGVFWPVSTDGGGFQPVVPTIPYGDSAYL